MSLRDLTWSARKHEIQSALRSGEFRLHYQPICDTSSLEIVAHESLLRWEHPLRGMIFPNDFIPLAERTGLIHELGLWVVRQACRDVAVLGARYVGVNVSAIQLQSETFASNFAGVLSKEGVLPTSVTVEITESVALKVGGVERRNLDAIRGLGCYLAIDDFGTGYSSYDYVEQFPFNVIKIDKSYMRNIVSLPAVMEEVAAICEIGRQRDIVIVAEGVETPEQLEILRDLGCSRGQGYLLGRPAPIASCRRTVTPMDRTYPTAS